MEEFHLEVQADTFNCNDAPRGHHAVAEPDQGVRWIAGRLPGPLGAPHGGTGKILLPRAEVDAGSIAFDSSNMVAWRCIAYSRHAIEYLPCTVRQGTPAVPARSVTSPKTADIPAVLQLRSHDGLGQSERVDLAGNRLVLRRSEVNIAACVCADDERDPSARRQG